MTEATTPGAAPAERPALPRLEFRIERLNTVYRFTYAFHAREVRFERDAGNGPEKVFPETFSFHADRHDPTELYLRFEDLWNQPTLLAVNAGRRDAEELVKRLLRSLPHTLAAVLLRLRESDQSGALIRASEDVAALGQVALRFLSDKDLAEQRTMQMARFHWRKLVWQCLVTVMEERVRPEFVEAYVAGSADPEVSPDPHDVSFFHALASGDPEHIDPAVVGAAERAFVRWLEEVCLDEENRAFERASSPFASREEEVLDAVTVTGASRVDRGRDMTPFLRRPGNRDCERVLGRLETWFLRQYDIRHAAAMITHAVALRQGDDDADRVLSRHGTRNYALALGIPAAPFIGAIFAYDRWPRVFDALVSLEVIAVLITALWFFAYRFAWKKDLTVFHASVPRVGAGIIVGYLPVFLIDEVWDLAAQAPVYILATIAMLGSVTLLYLYVEVQRRIGDPTESFARARHVFLLGLVEAAGFGLIVTSLLGPLMAARNWGPEVGGTSIERLPGVLEPFLGQLPSILGFGPFYAFPTAVLLMSFMAFFIGTFLQLLWEELPITEPL
ncbi:MAG: hypothetical protein CL910_09080 [Deltaproteobacteria bacterium]|jgi:hypothetical protein|nr:hypothetical protein [Deltaproteobacteria bacterium]